MFRTGACRDLEDKLVSNFKLVTDIVRDGVRKVVYDTNKAQS